MEFRTRKDGRVFNTGSTESGKITLPDEQHLSSNWKMTKRFRDEMRINEMERQDLKNIQDQKDMILRLEEKRAKLRMMEDPEKLTTNAQKEFEAFEKLSKISKPELNKLENAIDEAIEHYKFRTRKVVN